MKMRRCLSASEVFGADTEGDAGSVVVWFPLVIMSHSMDSECSNGRGGRIGSVSDIFYEFRKIMIGIKVLLDQSTSDLPLDWQYFDFLILAILWEQPSPRSASVQSAQSGVHPNAHKTQPVKQSKPAPPPTKKPSKRKLPQKVRKGKPSFQLVDEDDEAQQESIPHEEGNDPDIERAKKMSLEALQDQRDREGEGDDAIRTAFKLSLDVQPFCHKVGHLSKLFLVSDLVKAHEACAGWTDPGAIERRPDWISLEKLHGVSAGPNPEPLGDEFSPQLYPKVYET
ncbi:hypothetical protein Tco_0466264 [Tanacetum coccineum]